MKFNVTEPPRVFGVGKDKSIRLKDCAHIQLEADEQVTFTTLSGSEYDVVRKAWGYYATPSLNKRLLSFGLKSFLVKSSDGTFFIFLVEEKKESEFQHYLKETGLKAILCLGDPSTLQALEKMNQAPIGPTKACPFCQGTDWKNTFHYKSPPAGEVRFQFSANDYVRDVFCCQNCGHFVSVHQMNQGALYQQDYVNATYGDDQGMRRNFDRINSLDANKSDNIGRVKRILEFVQHSPSPEIKLSPVPSVMDIGSGLCVFLYRMKQAGWDCSAVDPDPRAAKHAQEVVDIKSHCSEFMSLKNTNRVNLITFNKVLEHVEDPVSLLAKSKDHLTDGGFVYVELPDGEAAVKAGPEREEFFIEHLHVFSAASLNLLASRAGFTLKTLERLREPSGKYTLRAFLKGE